ncbi:MAG TPA: tetratricopeptide repeat protein [Bryobacteraceae bacterium]|nr:tetratricopeptide repeat protein [Bryobacteraceae bacterium]
MAADYETGRLAFAAHRYDAAMRELEPVAQQGNAQAQYLVGAMLSGVDGVGVKENAAEAAKWFRKAADQGHAEAQLILGLLYAKGDGGLHQDIPEAAKWLRKAADQGDRQAQYSLGALYENDYQWYRLAADQGDTKAQAILAHAFSKGLGVPLDYVRAHMLYDLAASGSSGAERKQYLYWRESVSSMMTPQQIAEATRLAREWKPLDRISAASESRARPWAAPPIPSSFKSQIDALVAEGLAGVTVATPKRGVLPDPPTLLPIGNLPGNDDRWVRVTESVDGKNVYFYDSKTIERKSSLISYWYKVLNADGSSRQVAYDVECGSRRERVTRSVSYSKDGRASESRAATTDWERVIPDSVGETFYALMCGQ